MFPYVCVHTQTYIYIYIYRGMFEMAIFASCQALHHLANDMANLWLEP